mgnify:CR=1 FL=1
MASLIVKLKAIAWGLRKSGAMLVLVAVVGVGWIYTPLIVVEINYKISSLRSLILRQFPGQMQTLQESKIRIKNLDEYSIYIPKINARSKVISNVDAGNPAVYTAALKLGVAEAANLSHPGQKGTTYLFAHSTDSPVNFARYNAIFYLLDKLKDIYKEALVLKYIEEFSVSEIAEIMNKSKGKGAKAKRSAAQSSAPGRATLDS